MGCDHVFIELALSHPDLKLGQILGIAAVRTDRKGKPLTAFSEKVKPETDFTPEEKTHVEENFAIGDRYSGESLSQVVKDLKSSVLSKRYDSKYVIVATHAESVRAFLGEEVFGKKPWLDILAISWPLAYHDHVSDRTFDSLCKSFKVENTAPDTATGNCEALVRVYWAMMTRYKTALGGEEILREVGGSPLEHLRKYIGL